jgi:hypothetical protein
MTIILSKWLLETSRVARMYPENPRLWRPLSRVYSRCKIMETEWSWNEFHVAEGYRVFLAGGRRERTSHGYEQIKFVLEEFTPAFDCGKEANPQKALGIGHTVRDLASAVVVFLEFLIKADDNLQV